MRFWLLLVILLSFSFPIYSQDLSISNYSVSEGLPQSQVFDVEQGQNGLLWVATRGGGIASFDGLKFNQFNKSDGLVHDFVNTVFCDSRGLIWVGTSNGLSLYNGIRFRTIEILKNKNLNISSVVEGRANEIYIGSNQGVFKRLNKKVYSINRDLGLPNTSVISMHFDSLNFLWIAHRKGLTRYKSGKSKQYKHPFFKKAMPQCVFEDKNRNIWVGTYGKGICKVKGSTLHFVEQTNGLIVKDIVEYERVMLLSTLKNGIVVYNKSTGAVRPFISNHILPTLNCRSLKMDSWGNIWLGTSGGGLVKLFQKKIENIHKEFNVKGSYVYAVTPSVDSGMWFTTNALKLYKIKGNDIEEYGLNRNIYPLKIKRVYQDKNANLWLGTEGKGVWMWNDEKMKRFSAGSFLSSNYVTDIISDKQGRTWVATTHGVSCFKGTQLDKKYNYYAKRITAIWCDRSNRIWCGTRNNGVFCLEEPTLSFNVKNGLSDNAVRDITENKNGELIVATANGGVNYISIYNEKQKIKSFKHLKGHYFNNIYSIGCSASNELWLGTAGGVYKITHPFSKKVVVKHFGKSEGFSGVETTKGAVAKDLQGNWWWGTINGLMKVKTEASFVQLSKPRLALRKVSLFYNDIQETAYEASILNWYEPNNLKLEFEDNHIGFDLLGVDLNKPSGMMYKWRLDGGNGRWSPYLKTPNIYLSNLSPGKYIFQAKAINKDGVESDQINFYFTVIAPFYYKVWFWISVVLVLVLVVLWRVKVRINKIKKEAEELNKKLLLEKEVLELEQKSLRLQMNPHFIFNALNAIQNLIRKQENKMARYSLSKFSKLMRDVLDASQEDIISISQEIQMLNDYLNLEKITRADSFDYKVEWTDNLDVEEEGIPPMILQPFIENAIIHGLGNKEGKGFVKVYINTQDEFLILTVEDNGVGFSKAKSIKAQTNIEHKSVALSIIQERLNALGSTGGFEMEELQDENKKVIGTRVTITLKRQSVW